MNIFFGLYFFLLGIAIGSFLNVVIYRYNTGKGILGRSQCFSCNRTLAWYDLIPVFSFLFHRGKCRTCKSRISWQYPLVELFTGILFLGIYFNYSGLLERVPGLFAYQSIYSCIEISLLVFILVYDLRHKIIPNTFVYTFAFIALIHMFIGLTPLGHIGIMMPAYTFLLAGPILAFPFYLFWLISGGRWMGLGDAKLALGIGWFLGLSAGGSAILYGFWIGAIVSIAILLLEELVKGKKGKSERTHRVPKLSMKSEIPFAPFLIAGLLIVFFFRYNIFAHLLFI